MNIPQFMPTITKEDINAVNEYMNSGAFITEYKHSREFEKILAEISETKYALLFPNGTLTIFAILKCLNLSISDKVLIPNYTMAATAFAPIEAGYDIKFADVDYPELTLSLETIKREYDKDPNIKVIIFVAANGRDSRDSIEAIKKFCDENSLILIEDAAQGLGSKYSNGKPVGSVGYASSISFSMPKIITTGQGGVVLTNKLNLFEKLKNYRDFGRERSGIDSHLDVGLNLKFTDLQAILGISQIGNLNYRVKKKKEIFNAYKASVKSEYLKILDNPDNVAPWFIEVVSESREKLINHLKISGIGTRPMYPPLNRQAAFINHPQSDMLYKNSERIGRDGLWLPSYYHLEFKQIEYIASNLNKFRP